MRLYDGTSDIDWFYRGPMTAAEMAEDPELSGVAGRACVLYDDGAGRVYGWAPLDSLADRYGVEVSTPQATFDAVVEAMGRPAPPEVTPEALQAVGEKAEAANEAAMTATLALADLGETAGTVANAVAELGVMTATGMESAAELGTMTATSMESVAELGGTVAALEARIAALEAAQA